MNSPEYKQLMAELKADYLASFPEKFATLNNFFANKQWDKLELEFHKLKGTGKTYGVPEVSVLCQKMEDLCRMGPEKVTPAFDKSVQVLKAIHDAYEGDKEFDLEADPRYLDILAQTK